MVLHPTVAEINALYRTDFRAFLRKAFRIIFPNKELMDNWHLDAIAHELENVRLGKIRRSIINIPPRSMKSLICSVFWPAYLIGRDPSFTVMVVSHSMDLAIELSNKFRELIGSKVYLSIFPAMKGAISKDTESDIVTNKQGGRIALSVMSNVTGRGADLIIMDDPMDASDADNEVACDTLFDWVRQALMSRLNNPATSSMLLVMQRLSIYDLSARLDEQGGWRKGDLLHEARNPASQLEEQRMAMGDRAYSAQYLQAPFLDGAGVVKWSDFQFVEEPPNQRDRTFICIDAASGSESGSYTVILLCCISDGRLYVYGHYRQKVTLPELYDVVLKAYEDHSLDHIVAEKASNGIGLLQLLTRHFKDIALDIGKWHSLLQAISPSTSKEIRMEQAMVSVKQGKVLLLKDRPWLPVLRNEFEAFPKGRYDDQVDAFSQAVDFFVRIMERDF